MSGIGAGEGNDRIVEVAKELARAREDLAQQSRDSSAISHCLGEIEAETGVGDALDVSGPAINAADIAAANELITLDSLLPPETISRLERRHLGGFTRSHRIDRWDVLAGCFAGLVGGAIDILLVGIPKDITYRGVPYSQGPLPGLLKRWQVESDNWLAKVATTAYDDFQAGADVPGMGGRTHRLLTPGHDPLLGLVLGTLDIVRGSRTALSATGALFADFGLKPGEVLPVAVVMEVLHLLSDVATPMGLPAPGWTLTPLLQAGSFGPKERTVADLARYMYLNGYDLRNFIASLSSPAAIELVLLSYSGGRRYLDGEYDRDCRAEEEPGAAKRKHPRYKSMRLIGDALACAANAGKVAIYQGNPLALNYPQWLALARSSISYLADCLESPTDVVVARSLQNEKMLEEEWDALYARLLRGSLEQTAPG